MRISFDFLLDIMLLYPEERPQLTELKEEGNPYKPELQGEDIGAVSSEQ